MDAKKAISKVRDHLAKYAVSDSEGNYIASDAIGDAVSNMYDGIVQHEPHKDFPNMGIDPDAKHYIVWDPKQIKSKFSKGFDPDSDDVRASERDINLAESAPGITHHPLPIQISPTLKKILSELDQKGHKSLIVGGAVRDAIRGEDPKDIDIETYGTNFDQLAETLSKHGRVDQVGKAFGVIKFTDPEGHDYDFSIPRRENKTGVGHKDFQTDFDPSIGPKEAAARRDFTFNSLAYDPLSHELHDYYGGKRDLDNGILRHTSHQFAEDPLRVLRGMQFAGRMGLQIAPETAHLAQQIAHEHSTLPKERISEEWMKLATKGKTPGSAIQYLKDTGWIDNYPELKKIVDAPQDPEWHPEGAVDVHTAHVMNEAARIADRDGLKGDARAALVFAAMTHDLAKAHTHDGGTTELRDKKGQMRWTAHGHEQASVPMAKNLLRNMGIKNDIVSRVLPMVGNHLRHVDFQGRPGEVRKLAVNMHPSNIESLAQLIEADHSGRPPLPKEMPENAVKMLEEARADGVSSSPPHPLIQGRDVLPYYQGMGGPHVGQAVKAAYDAQVEGHISDKDEAMGFLDRYVKPKASLLRGEDVTQHIPAGPNVGEVLNKAWDAQKSGEFSDRDSAVAWLQNHLK
jgi:tRNA nucleotidyltransferase (CCA-adding enzyme)